MSLLNALLSTLNQQNVSQIACAVGQSDQQSVLRGMQSAIATVLGGMARQSQNPTFLQRILNMAPVGRDVSWSSLSSDAADPNGTLISVGKQMTSSLFGGSESMLAHTLGAGTGLQPGVTSSLLSMAAPMVVGFLGKQVHDEAMSMEGLGTLLQREIPAIRAAVPTGITSLIWPHEREAIAAPTEAVRTAAAQSSKVGWLLPVLLLVLVPAFIWLFSHKHNPISQAPRLPAAGTANRATPESPKIPESSLPGSLNLYFQTGSTKLRPDSYAQLTEFAAALAAKPNVNLTVNGYTDNVGDVSTNMRLSRERADAVKSDLLGMGIPADRLTAQGLGEENPIADNATAKGRELNRRVTVEPSSR
jgi:OmpA-OmpF porin, OOP family